jgi:hypothetical protein
MFLVHMGYKNLRRQENMFLLDREYMYIFLM